MKAKTIIICINLLFFSYLTVFSQNAENSNTVLETIENNSYKLSFSVENGKLFHEFFELKNPAIPGSVLSKLTGDGNFTLEIIDNKSVELSDFSASKTWSKNDFQLIKHYKITEKQAQIYVFEYKLQQNTGNFWLKVKYSLGNADFFYRKQLIITDSTASYYLVKNNPINGFYGFSYEKEETNSELQNNLKPTLIKKGGFGQPVAITTQKRGMFAGVEHPASVNLITTVANELISVSGTVTYNQLLSTQATETACGIIALTPDTQVENLFYEYIKRISSTKPTPFLLFEMPSEFETQKKKTANEPEWSKTFEFITKELKDNYAIKFDAILLETKLSEIKNRTILINDQITQTYAGIGYKLTTSDVLSSNNSAHELADLISDYDINYLEFNNLDFPAQPTDSALTELTNKANLLIKVLKQLKTHKSSVSITLSDAWLSPWWLMYANWVNSENETANSWFPPSNLYNNNAKNNNIISVFNLAAFLLNTESSLFKINLLPQSATAEELKTLAEYTGLFLKQTGFTNAAKPLQLSTQNHSIQSYYQNKNQSIIITLSNSDFESQIVKIPIHLLAANNQNNWFAERIYPTREILNKVYQQADTLTINLHAYETAIYALSKIEDAKRPLITGVVFETLDNLGNFNKLNLLKQTHKANLLNPEFVNSVYYNHTNIEKETTDFGIIDEEIYQNLRFNSEKTKKSISISANFSVSPSVSKMQTFILIESATLPSESQLSLMVSDEKLSFTTEKLSNNKLLIIANLKENTNQFALQILADKTWQGKVEVWFSELTDTGKNEITYECTQVIKEPRLLPKPYGNSRIFNLKKWYETEFK